MRTALVLVALASALVCAAAYDINDIAIAELPPFDYDRFQALSDDATSYNPFDDGFKPQAAFPFEIPHAKPAVPSFLSEQEGIRQSMHAYNPVDDPAANQAQMTGNGPDEPDAETLKDYTPASSDAEDEEDTLPDSVVGQAAATHPLPSGADADEASVSAADVDMSVSASASEDDDVAPTPLEKLSSDASADADASADRFQQEEPQTTKVAGAATTAIASAIKTPEPAAAVAAPATEEEKKTLHKCVGDESHCVVAFNPHSIKWTTSTVPAGTFKDDPLVNPNAKKESQEDKQVDSLTGKPTATGTSSSSTGAPAAGGAEAKPQLSSDPAIRQLEEAFYTKKREVDTEEKWVKEVKATIAEYETKVRRVQAHIWKAKSDLDKSKRNIILAIKREKEKKLTAELRVALESLHKLNSHSTVLGSKLNDLTKQKLSLSGTIDRIKGALGITDISQYLPKKTSDDSTGASMRFREKLAANNQAKDLIKALGSLAAKHSNIHVVPVSHDTVVVHQLPSGLTRMSTLQRMRMEDNARENAMLAAASDKIDEIAARYH